MIGGTFPLTGPASLYAPIPQGHGRLLQVGEPAKGCRRQARRLRPQDRLEVLRRRLQPREHRAADEPAGPAGQGVRDRRHARDRAEHPDPAAPEPAEGPAHPRLDGASYWGLQYKQFPWTSGWQPDYIAEGIAYGRWIAQNAPNAKIAVFFQNDDYGKDYLKGLKIGLAAKRTLIVSELGYEITDTSYASQIARQKATGADTWVLLTTPSARPCARSQRRKALELEAGQPIVINAVAAHGRRHAAQRWPASGAEYVERCGQLGVSRRTRRTRSTQTTPR